uniref:Uncharacterized protein n=1 Tax=Trichuris muris TaxID=70415 RepID=A0A5S6QN88_TRIMR
MIEISCDHKRCPLGRSLRNVASVSVSKRSLLVLWHWETFVFSLSRSERVFISGFAESAYSDFLTFLICHNRAYLAGIRCVRPTFAGSMSRKQMTLEEI